MLVGVGQGRARGRRDPQVLELALATPQAAADLAQRMRPPELAKHHGDELTPARQPFARVLGVGLSDHALKVQAWNQLEYLAEHAA